MNSWRTAFALASCTLAAIPLPAAAQDAPKPGPGMVLTRSTDKSPEAVVEAVKTYAEANKWLYMGASKAKKGEVTMVKVCLPEVGQMLWQVGLHVSALLPCGNLGVYLKQGKTEVAMLHPAYMAALYPDARVEEASTLATPLLIKMLDGIAK